MTNQPISVSIRIRQPTRNDPTCDTVRIFHGVTKSRNAYTADVCIEDGVAFPDDYDLILAAKQIVIDLLAANFTPRQVNAMKFQFTASTLALKA